MRSRGGKVLFDGSVALLYALLVLWITRPWIWHPLSSIIAHYDPDYRLVNIDVMLSLSLSGWFKFALTDLHIFPLAHTTFLMFPVGAAHGLSFDGLLLGIVVSLLWCLMPLVTAYNVGLLLGAWATGFVMYRLGKRLWGRGLLAACIGLCAVAMPYFMQRLGSHPNLIHIWVLPAAIHLHLNWRAKPTLKRSLALGLALPLLAASSWYILILGLIYLTPAALFDVALAIRGLFGRRAAGGDTVRRLGHFLLGWGFGGVCVLAIGWMMITHAAGRQTYTPQSLAPYSTPLLQYLLPFPLTWAGNLAWAARLQQHMGTDWEGWAGGPVLAFVLLAVYALWRRAPGPRLLLCLAAAMALLATLGPFLSVTHLQTPGEGLKTPVYYLGRLFPPLLSYRVPGRVHPMFNILALLAAGWVLYGWFGRAPRTPRRQAMFVTVLTLFTAVNLCWSLPITPYVNSPAPPVSKFYRELRAEAGGAVLDLPFSFYWFPHYDYYQLIHARPAVSSVLFHDAVRDRERSYILGNHTLLLYSEMAKDVLANTTNTTTAMRAALSGEWFARLQRDGIDYVVVHPLFSEFLLARGTVPSQMRDFYAQCAVAWRGRLVYEDADLRAYRTGPPIPPAPDANRARIALGNALPRILTEIFK
jgi:hypothetical protein